MAILNFEAFKVKILKMDAQPIYLLGMGQE
jgi:hypothetical protein